jgi:NTE family protein
VRSLTMSGDDIELKPADLVLEGGGVKGIGLAGAIVRLDAEGYRFKRVAGSSAGAIAACVVTALQATNTPISQLQSILQTIQFEQFMRKSHLRKVLGAVGDAEHLLLHMGMFDGDYLIEWLSGVLSELKAPTHFGEIKTKDLEADCTRVDNQYPLVVTTSDITRAKSVRLPWDYKQYGLEPDNQRLVDAVRASMSIPFFFEPVRFRAPAVAGPPAFAAGNVTWVDGGMLDNFPVDVFDRYDSGERRWETIGVKLSAQSVTPEKPANTDGAINEAIACLHTALDNADRFYVTDDRASRTIFVDNHGIKSTDFGLTAADQQTLFDSGTKAAQKWITAAAQVAAAT